MVKMPKRQTLVRTDTQQILGMCGPNYQILKHADAVDTLNNALKETGFDYNEKTILTKVGARLFHHVTFEGMNANIDGEDVALQLIMLNSYDGSCPFDLDLGGYRFVCQNGMRVGTSLERTRSKHTASLNYKHLIKKIKLKVQSFNDVLIPFWASLAEYDANLKEGREIIEGIIDQSKFPKRHGKKVLQEWNRQRTPITGGRNAWGIYNAFTSVITHQIQDKHFERGHSLGRSIMPSFEALAN